MKWRLRFLLLMPVLLAAPASADEALDRALEAAAGGIGLHGTVILADGKPGAAPVYSVHHYQDSGGVVDFWPASTIKLYAVLGALERLHEAGHGLETTVQFARRAEGGRWVNDCARTVPEMLSEVFVRSSNEDYTLLLRMTGRDWLNGQFLIPGRGFQYSALMRGYVTRRPYVYRADEAQRVTVLSAAGTDIWEHSWAGRFWAQERGATVIDAKTGNCTSTGDLAECLRRVMFHEFIPAAERFRISDGMIAFLREGGDGFCGLETKAPDSGPYAWEQSGEVVYSRARFFHKSGLISNYVLELACVDDRAQSGRAVILALSANTGKEDVMRHLCRAALEWAKALPAAN